MVLLVMHVNIIVIEMRLAMIMVLVTLILAVAVVTLDSLGYDVNIHAEMILTAMDMESMS